MGHLRDCKQLKHIQALGPTQPPIQWVLGALFLGIKRPGREADHSLPSSAEVKGWVALYLHSPNTPSWPWWSVKAQGQLYLYFTLQAIRTVTCLLLQERSYHGTVRKGAPDAQLAGVAFVFAYPVWILRSPNSAAAVCLPHWTCERWRCPGSWCRCQSAWVVRFQCILCARSFEWRDDYPGNLKFPTSSTTGGFPQTVFRCLANSVDCIRVYETPACALLCKTLPVCLNCSNQRLMACPPPRTADGNVFAL
jgi:hypothetical protein